MPELRDLSGKEVIAILTREGFIVKRTQGSHTVLRRGNEVCVVPLHDELALGTLRNVLRQAQISIEEFMENK